MEKLLREQLKGGTFGVVSPENAKRMRAVRGRGNRTTELQLRWALVRAGLSGWQLHPRGLVGNPDFFFPNSKVAVFVDGCFWHGCSKCGHIPRKNNAFWETKIRRNQERDADKTRQLISGGIRVLRFWEHELKEDASGCVNLITAAVSKAIRFNKAPTD